MNTSKDSCPICDKTQLKLLVELRDTDHVCNELFKVMECEACGLALSSPLLTHSELGPFYENAYYAKTQGGLISKIFDRVEERFYQARIKHVLKYIQTGKLLDIGCGHGRFVLTAERKGFQAEGLEFSESGQSLSEDRKLKIHKGDLLEMTLEEETYDIITCWHSFEHFPQPKLYLNKMKQLLKPGGLLLIAVPNYKSWEAGQREQLKHWLHLDVPRHQFHFSPQALQKLLTQEQLRIQGLRFSCFEHNFAGMLVTLQNRWGASKNFFYDFAKRGHLFHPPKNVAKWLITGGVLTFSFAIAPLLMLWNMYLERSSRSGCYLLVSKKEGDWP